MPRKRRQEEHVNLERWLISYADFITLLFAFFVVMYAISSVNEGKYRVLSDTLEEAFNSESPTTVDAQKKDSEKSETTPVDSEPEVITQFPEPSIIDPVVPVESGSSVIEMLQQTAQDNQLGKIADEVERAMMPLIEDDLINIKREDLWVEVEIKTSLLFLSGDAELAEESLPILAKIAAIVRGFPNYVQVEGFTDNLPISTYVYPSNWELSGARAASVVRVFMENGVPPNRMAAIGYGEFRPVADNATNTGRERNRRVVLVILADTKARRALDINRTNQLGLAGPVSE